MDRLSQLPTSLLHLILSFLSMRDVVSTTLLSKHWNNLWTSVPCLNFCEDINGGGEEKIRNFVNRALMMWNGTKIMKFKISINNLVDSSLAGDLDLWVQFAVKYKVEELEVLYYNRDNILRKNAYLVPQCLYSCSSIRILSLVGCKFLINGSLPWNQLKSLNIYCYRLSEHSINQILLGSPRLEVLDLYFVESRDNLNIMSTSLKKLIIYRDFVGKKNKSPIYTVFTICCPNLEILEFEGGPYGKCLFTDLSSLTDATLHFVDEKLRYDEHLSRNEFGEAMRQVFSTHVKKVALSDFAVLWCAQVLAASPKEYLYSPNVEVLKLFLDEFNAFTEVVALLRIFPNLKILDIDSPFTLEPTDFVELERNLPETFLLQLKKVNLVVQLYKFSNFQYIEFLLKHAVKLEKLVLLDRRLTSYRQQTLNQISEKLLGMPRSSPTAKVILNNDFIIA